jgi:transposase
MNDEGQQIIVGIDVSKTCLYIRAKDEDWSVGNDWEDVVKLVARLQGLQPGLVVIESTGGLERLVPTELAAHGVPVALVNPRRVREFAKLIGLLGKTDKIDV